MAFSPGCFRPDEAATNSTEKRNVTDHPTVYVVNYPLYYFSQRIAGDMAEVVFPAPADEDPAYWSPRTETIQSYQQADLILLNGARYAKWVQRASLAPSKVAVTSQSFRPRYIQLEDSVVHSHGPQGEHTHATTAITTWLDPTLAVLQAATIRDRLVALMPKREQEIQKNFETLKVDLQNLDRLFHRLLGNGQSRPLLASHPVYQYFARRYQLHLKSMHWEPNPMPDDEQWAQLDRLLESHPARWMIWEAPPTAEIEGRLKERGVHCVVFYPCGNVPVTGDYLTVMQENAERLQQIFSESLPAPTSIR